MKTVRGTDGEYVKQIVQDMLRSYSGRGFFPSACVRVFTSDRTVCVVPYGGVEENAVFDVASLTKIATSTQILLLIENGKLSLDTPVLHLLPSLSQYPVLAERLSGVTVYRLLTHTSGIIDWYPFYAVKSDFAYILNFALERYAPVQGMVYSDLNFMLLGSIIESLRGLPLHVCLQQDLVSPLALGLMTYLPDPALPLVPSSYGNPIEEAMCAERGIVFDGWRPHMPLIGQVNDGNAHYFFGGVAGSAGIFATAEATQRLCQYYMRTDSKLLTDAQLAHEPTRGLGFQVGDMYPRGCGHTGFTGTSIYLSRDLDLGVVAFTNRLYYPYPNPNATNEFRKDLHHTLANLFHAV